ncbi:hypothetical protein ACI3KS_14190 [Microbacterium sp. ZW T5_45]|uniref:DoxX family protein n=1 Tax=Microbacterium sp. ZW T5_45 TaxID=3378080 RepID=UPI0038532571
MKAAARGVLALLLAVAGVMHFTQTRGFRVVVPDWATRVSRLDADTIVIASGAAEIALATGLVALPKERRRIGWATAIFFAAVFPGNVHQWRTRRSAPGLDTDARRFGRIFLQPVLIAWAVWSTSGARR